MMHVVGDRFRGAPTIYDARKLEHAFGMLAMLIAFDDRLSKRAILIRSMSIKIKKWNEIVAWI
jgi:hypothetical protein